MIELRGLHLGNIARSPAESVRPDLWPDHAWIPALGCTGGVLYDLCTTLLNGGTAYGSVSWGASGLSNGGVGALWLGPIGLLGSGHPLAYTGDFSIFVHCPKIDSAPTGSVLVSCRSNAYPFGWLVEATAAGVWAFRSTQLSDNAAVLGTSPFGSVQANQSIGVVFKNTVAEMFGGGVASGPLCTVTGGINYIYGARHIASTLLGASINNAATELGQYVDGTVGALLSFDYALTPSQILDLTADPLLPFRRRQPVYYSVPSGGGTARSLIAALTGESSTGTIAAIIARALSGDVTATSITGAITSSMARELLASLPGQSATGDVAATLQRLLLASLGGASLTGDVSATMSGIVSLIAAINGQSATGTAAATQARALLADLQASSATPDIAATLAALVALTANISGTTTTPAVAAATARALAANLVGQSTTGAIAVEFAGMLLLVASIAGTSTTGALTATTGRELRAAIATASTTGQVDGQLLRQIAATIAGTSLTGAIAAELVNLVSLAASVVGVSLTPVVVATISRDLAAEVAAGSTTGAASATVARTLAAAVEAGTLTPDNLALILTGLGILHDTTIISRTPRRGITSRTVRRTIHSA